MAHKNASRIVTSISVRNAARRRRTALALAGVSLIGLGLAPAASAQTMPDPTALPSGGTVVAGSVQIATDGTTMTVDQASARGIINWQRFDIGEQGSVVFRQPDANAVTLNRVISGAGSTGSTVGPRGNPPWATGRGSRSEGPTARTRSSAST